MKITRKKLMQIIEEEMPDVLKLRIRQGEGKAENKDKESDRERKRRIFGHGELDKLANGIVEDDELEDEDEEEVEESNRYFGPDGKFTSKEDATCVSTYFQDKKRKGGKPLPDKDDTGRGRYKNKGKGRFLCKSGEPLWQEAYKRYVEEIDSPHDERVDAPSDLYDCAKKLQDQEVLIRKMKAMVKQAEKDGSKECPLSYQDAIRIINQLEKASKGKAYEKG